jgi:hypothetical protein
MFFDVISDPLELTRLLEEQFEDGGFHPLFDARMLDEIASARDRRTLNFFRCLLHAPQDKVVLRAIEGLCKIGDPDVIPTLEERAMYDPSPQVRKAAQNPVTPPSVKRCALSTVDGWGSQMCILIWRTSEGVRVGVNILLSDELGIRDCTVLEGEKPVTALEQALEHHFDVHGEGAPLSIVEVSLAQARTELERAYRISLHARKRLPPVYIALRDWLWGEDTRSVTTYPVPQVRPEEVDTLLQRSPELFQLVEFSSWIFDLPGPEARWRRHGRKFLVTESEEARAALITQALTKVLNPELCARIKMRLERQAWFLAQLYEEDELPKMALAASAALGDASVSPLEHPFLREMMRKTLASVNDTSI